LVGLSRHSSPQRSDGAEVRGMKAYDVCVVGAGIAGSSFAYNVAGDLDACVIERDGPEEVGNKPCGEGVHKYWFGRGVRPNPWDLGAAVQDIRRIELNLQGESLKVELGPDREGLMLDRKKFVREAFSFALDHGCEHVRAEARPKFEGKRVSHVEAGKGRIRARLYVDASGASAVIRGRYVPNRAGAFALGYRELIEHELGDESWHVYVPNNREAYWVFPKGGATNVGYATVMRDADYLAKLEGFKRKIGLGNGRVIDAGAAPIPIHRPIDLVYENAVAIGDAGFTVNPAAGGGIGPSVWAANLLADTLKEGRDLGDFERRYWDRVGAPYLRYYWLMRLIRSGLAWKRVVRWALQHFYGANLSKGGSE